MKKFYIFGIFLLLAIPILASTNFRIMTYNALIFDQNGIGRLSYFKKIIEATEPQIILMQEIVNQQGADSILIALKEIDNEYVSSNFINGPGTDNMLYYKNTIISLIEQDTIQTALRNISKYKISIDNKPLNLYCVHFKAGDETVNINKRFEEASILRNRLNQLPLGTEFIIAGDMNFYYSDEPGYQKLISEELNNNGRAEDLYDEIGYWHNSYSLRNSHTQSTRVSVFGGGAGGGLDDRFDFILSSYQLNDNSNIEFNDNYVNYGNDGNHFNKSINDGMNFSVPDSITDALYYFSDHLPVYGDFICLADSSTTGHILISEYVEGSSYNKAIEIYNGTGIEIELSNYSLEKDLNGNGIWDYSYNYSGLLQNDSVFVLANPNACSQILAKSDDTDSWVINFNGNDQVRLLKNDEEIDRIGIPGDIYFGQNKTYVRKASITNPQSGPQDPRINEEWDEYPQDTFHYLGYHNMYNQILTLITPNGGELWKRAHTYNIRWESNDFNDNIKIEIFQDSEKDFIELISSTENDSIWEWTIPTDFPISDDYKIKISNANDSIPFDISNSCFTISGVYKISEIQTTPDSLGGPSPYEGEIVEIAGIVTGAPYNGYYIQDNAGAWNGIFVYDYSYNPSIGDSINISGNVQEYYEKTELKDISDYTLNSTGNILPEVVGIQTNDVNQEMYEGVLVKIEQAKCVDVDLGYGEWLVNDNSGDCRIDDQMYSFSPILNEYYNITGIVDYSYDNFKIEPRYSDDVSVFIPSPENLKITITDSDIILSWRRNSQNIFHIHRSTNPYQDFEIIATISDTIYTDENATLQPKYYYYITAE